MVRPEGKTHGCLGSDPSLITAYLHSHLLVYTDGLLFKVLANIQAGIAQELRTRISLFLHW